MELNVSERIHLLSQPPLLWAKLREADTVLRAHRQRTTLPPAATVQQQQCPRYSHHHVHHHWDTQFTQAGPMQVAASPQGTLCMHEQTATHPLLGTQILQGRDSASLESPPPWQPSLPHLCLNEDARIPCHPAQVATVDRVGDQDQEGWRWLSGDVSRRLSCATAHPTVPCIGLQPASILRMRIMWRTPRSVDHACATTTIPSSNRRAHCCGLAACAAD